MSAFEREAAAAMQSDDEEVDEPEFTTMRNDAQRSVTLVTTWASLPSVRPIATAVQDNAVCFSGPFKTESMQIYQPLLRELFSEFTIENVDYSAAIAQATNLVSLSKETFWLPATASPRCYLEELAQGIGMAQLRHHLQPHVSSEAAFQQALALCGFEWWVQVKHATNVDCNSTEDINDGIDLHYDKDETIAEQFGLGIFPALSTVTYLTSAESTTSDWTMIPFVSDKSQWGKDDAEAGLELYVWMPSVPLPALHAAQFNRPAPAVKGASKKRRTDKSIDTTTNELRSSREIPSTCTSYRFVFASDDVAAKLEYEEDEEGADDFGDEFCGIVNVKG
eukprot:gene7275-5230_t